jgi:TLD
MLYLAIPEIEANILPETEMLKEYKSQIVSASEIRRLFQTNPGPSVFLFQMGSGDSKRIFGGYANESWGNPGPFFGSESSFLFLMDKTGEKVKLRVNKSPPNRKTVILWHNGNNQLSFGERDLALDENVN